jgi:Heterokaryon incompatibility protein (HET)
MAAITRVLPRKWWIESPEVVSEDDPSFLCDVCKHINFQYLIFEILIWVVSEEIPLDSYSRILEKQQCAFCRLVKHTIDNIYRPDKLPTKHNGKAVMISMIATAETFNLDKKVSEPRQLLLWVKPDPLRKGRTPPLEIYHVVEDGWYNSGSGKGRLIPATQIDFNLPLFWNRRCRKSLSSLHEDHVIEREIYGLPANFRLIDTKKMCIVPANSSFEYIALSYTWGKCKQFKLSDDNYQELSEEGALLKHDGQIPQTIKDAICLVRKLCDRYLWVDALCIKQDTSIRSREDKKDQLPYMNRIYGSSVLTIAATYGDGADAGLPGVGENSRESVQLVKSIQGIRLANRPWSFDKSVTDSKWNTRAWTFQERILSSRILFIAKQQIFFKCDHVSGVLAEDLDSELKGRKLVTCPMEGTGTDIIPQRGSINILSYLRTVESFTARELTYPGDVLDAFSGIAQKMTPLFRSGFLSGLPQSELDYCLLWKPAGDLHRRTALGTDEISFPSWSWAGWIGPVRYTWEERLSRVKWVHPSSGELFTSDDYRSPFPSTSPHQQTNSNSRSLQWRKKWTEQKTTSGFRYFYHASNPDIWFRNPTAEPEQRPRVGPNCVLETNHLRFWAWTDEIVYDGEYVPPKDVVDPLWQITLTDKKGFVTGYFTVPVEVLPKLDFKNKKYDMVMICRTRTGCSRKDVGARKDGSEVPGAPFSEEGINFSKDTGESLEDSKPLEDYDDAKDVSMEPVFFPELPASQEARSVLCFDRQRYDPYKPFCLYEFLVVEWNGDVASRIGIGEIHIDAWAQQHPKEKLITLG